MAQFFTLHEHRSTQEIRTKAALKIAFRAFVDQLTARGLNQAEIAVYIADIAEDHVMDVWQRDKILHIV